MADDVFLFCKGEVGSIVMRFGLLRSGTDRPLSISLWSISLVVSSTCSPNSEQAALTSLARYQIRLITSLNNHVTYNTCYKGTHGKELDTQF